MAKDDPKFHWQTALTIYSVGGALIALAGYTLNRHRLVGATSIESGGIHVLVMALILGVVIGAIQHKWKNTRGAFVKIFSEGWHILLAWFGAGLASFGFAEIIGGANPKPDAMASALLGPAAFLHLPTPGLVVAMLLGYSVIFGIWLASSEFAHVEKGKKKSGQVAKVFGLNETDKAPASEPDDAHFAQVEEQMSMFVIPDSERARRVQMATAKLAADWGKPKRPIGVGLPNEGSGLIFGAPGSGKGVLLTTMILSAEKTNPKTNPLPTKFVVLSTKPRDLAGPTVEWLRSQDFAVSMWDLTGSTSGTDRYGDEVRWSPISSSQTFDDAKRTAKRIVESGRDQESRSRDAFWLQQAMLLLGPALFAAAKRNGSYEDALEWTSAWSDPEATDVDRILFSEGESAALAAWQGTRKLMLSKINDLEWTESKGGGAGGTGLSISATLAGLMLDLATEKAFAATANPNFDPAEWLRDEGNSALFLVGNTQERGMTRSLLATCVHELLTGANNLAQEAEDEKLPFRLVVVGDELANLAPIPEIENFYSTARSTRIQIMAVFQSYAQIESVYSREVARVLMDTSVATLVLSGISDSEFIQKLQHVGGQKEVERNEDSLTTEHLLGGHHITGLRPPNPTTGAPGTGFMFFSGGVAEVEVPLWSLTAPYDERGEIMPQHKASVEALKNDTSGAVAWLQNRRWFSEK